MWLIGMWIINKVYPGHILESKGICAIFQKKCKKKHKMVENLGKNVQNLKIFWKSEGDCMQ